MSNSQMECPMHVQLDISVRKLEEVTVVIAEKTKVGGWVIWLGKQP